VDSDPGEVITSDLDFPCVQSDTHLYAYGPNSLANGAGAFNGSPRAVEGCEESVSGVVNLPATESFQLPSDRLVVGVKKISPSPVAQLCRSLRRPHNVSEQDRGQNPISSCGVAGASQELLDLSQIRVAIAHEDEVVLASEFHQPGSSDALGEVFGMRLADPPVTTAKEDQRWRLDRREQRTDIAMDEQLGVGP
jgi:hypothetical protein